MPLTGLFFLPVPPNQSSPSPTIISHVSRSFPAEPLPAFYLDHRLFADTSSLLPNADTSLRRHTSILTLSHTPAKTYVGTSHPKDKSQHVSQPIRSPSLITIPSSSADSFTQLIGTKLQPQWAHRQSLVVENGTALSLENGDWIIRIGDLKTPSRPGQGVSNLRGMLIEVTSKNAYLESERTKSDKENVIENGNVPVNKDDETLIRGFLNTLTDGTGVQMDNIRAIFRSTTSIEKADGTSSALNWGLATLYMDMLRGSRG